MKIKFHQAFRHDCSDWSDPNDESKYAEFQATKPHQFRAGDEVDVPDDAAQYFIAGGVAAVPGEDPIERDPLRPVFVQPRDVVHKTSAENP